MRADRLLSELLLLQTSRLLTARELAERLEVSERTVHRDMEALGAAGVPVVAERGVGGGWSLLGKYETKLTGMNPAEIQTLFLTKPDQLLRDLGLDKAANAAVIKLLAALPAQMRHDAEYARRRIYVDVTGWRPSSEDVSRLPVVQEAVWQGRMLAMRYQRPGCTTAEQVAPLGLVAKGSVWYLVAVSTDGRPKSYRVSRILDARILDQPCSRPEDFDLAEFWHRSTTEFRAALPRYFCTIRVSPEALPWAEIRRSRVEERSEPDAQGWVTLRFRFDVEEEALQFALGFGPRVEVVEPRELREKVVRAAKALIKFYAR